MEADYFYHLAQSTLQPQVQSKTTDNATPE